MAIKPLSTKAKPPGYIDLHKAIHLVLQNMFPAQWQENKHMRGIPFKIKEEKSEVSAEQVCRKISRYKMLRSDGVKRPRIPKEKSADSPKTEIVSISQFEQEKQANAYIFNTWKKVRAALRKQKLRIRIRSTDDSKDGVYGYDDIGEAVWENRSEPILYTGHVPVQTPRTLWGILHINKKDVLELCTELKKSQQLKVGKVRRACNENDVQSLRNYIKRLSEAAQKSGHWLNHEGQLHIFITIEQCRNFVQYCAGTMRIKWKKDADFKRYFQAVSSTEEGIGFLNQLGIGHGGHPPRKPSNAPLTKTLIQNIEAAIHDEIASAIKK